MFGVKDDGDKAFANHEMCLVLTAQDMLEMIRAERIVLEKSIEKTKFGDIRIELAQDRAGASRKIATGALEKSIEKPKFSDSVIELVMNQTGVSRKIATSALEVTSGDIGAAIMCAASEGKRRSKKNTDSVLTMKR